tara:strand:- start:1118 stop:1321 length:204 start_codon:yes stop_codon:yes gene_type:complete
MGKMKELYMEMLEQSLNAPPEPVDTDITCPNCMKGKLIFIAVDDVVCYEPGCGHTFVLVDAKTVRFK